MAFLKKTLKKDNVSEVGETPALGRGQNSTVGILRFAHITEKAAAMAANDTYVFAVAEHANKLQIKKAVEARYSVTVTGVRIVASRVKEVRRGRQVGYARGIKKAYATIKKGQTIEMS
ncbi:MAG: 50S ribosomal protein L23 [bacterium]|nr:50S ribosomal protein L23 [bacterium]